MKLLASAAACACVLAVGVAAQALSTTGRPPLRADDFELAPAAGGAAAGGAVKSAPMRAPRRFSLVGLRWRGRAEPQVAVRVRREGRGWSRWVGLDSHAEHRPDARTGERSARGASSPLWVGAADWVQYRSTRRLPGLRLHFVRVRGTAPVARAAQEPQPGIVPRADWGASQCPPRSAPDYGEVKAAYIHHTVSLNDYSPEEAPGIVLAICRYHRNSNGWNDIGYNFLVDRYGVIYEGRAGGIGEAVVGAQAQGFNSQTTGVASIGDHSSVQVTPETLAAAARLIRWKLPLHAAATSGKVTLVSAGGSASRYPAGARVSVERVLGHRDTNHTSCPGDAAYAQLPQLRAMVQGAVIAGTPTRLTARLARGRVPYRQPALLSGVLSTAAGAPLAGEVLEIQVQRGLRWLTVASTPTGPSGTFQAALRTTGHRRMRARFPGRGDLRPSSSRAAVLRVRAAVALRRPPARGRRFQRIPVRGTVAPLRRRVFLVLELRRGAAWRRLGVTTLRVRGGRFGGFFVPASRGLYRFRVVATAGRSSDRGQSPPQLVLVR
jgi:N-acetylmuramoyl-L-alanine amidase